jgi:hypothetical protein
MAVVDGRESLLEECRLSLDADPNGSSRTVPPGSSR